MERANENFENGLSFESSDLLFQNNRQFFSEIEFPGYRLPEETLKNDFYHQPLTMQDLQIPFQSEGWEQSYPSEYSNFSGADFQTENLQNFQNPPDYKQGYQPCPDPGYIPGQEFAQFPPAAQYPTDQVQYLSTPQEYPKQEATNFTQSPNTLSDYYSGNNSSDSSPPHSYSSDPTSNSSPSTKPIRSKTDTQPKHNVGNLPDGLMKALTTVLSKTNNPSFKQLMQSQDSLASSKKCDNRTRKLASRPSTDNNNKRVPITKVPLVKVPLVKVPLVKVPLVKVPLGNKPSLEEMRQKKAERMIRNREAALQSRQRKLEEQAALEETCRELQDRNIQLEKQVSFLEGRLSQLEETNGKLETQLSKYSRPSKVLASVCFLMFVSFIAFSSWPTGTGPHLAPISGTFEYKSRMLAGIPAQPVDELHWLLSPLYNLWNRASWLFNNDKEKYELAIPHKRIHMDKRNSYSYVTDKYTDTEKESFLEPTRFEPKDRYISDGKLDNLIIAYPQQEWPAGLNSTEMHSDFVHFFKNLSVSKEYAVSGRGNTGMSRPRPMMLRFPPEGIPMFSKFLNETSFIFESLQPEFQKRPQNLFVVALDHALWVPSRSTPNQTLSIILPSPRDISGYFPWIRWDCAVTGYQHFLTPIPSNYFS